MYCMNVCVFTHAEGRGDSTKGSRRTVTSVVFIVFIVIIVIYATTSAITKPRQTHGLVRYHNAFVYIRASRLGIRVSSGGNGRMPTGSSGD